MPAQTRPSGETLSAAPRRPRFSWPLRLFLFAIVFDMVFHSLAVLLPYKDWCEELDIDKFPRRLPTLEEVAEAAEADPDDPYPAYDRVMKSLDSVWDFFMPWPDGATRKKITSWEKSRAFAICWLTSRLGFLEQLACFEQKWTMFSPNVGRRETLARGRLLYADGSTRVVRLSADPEDLTHYGHWFKEKVLEYETKVEKDWDARLGWCNLVAHRYPTSAGGARLTKIYLVEIRYRYPEPDEDAEQVMREQSGPPGWEKQAPFWEYDVQTRKGRKLSGR